MNLEYYDGKNEIPEGDIRISPSQISKFFDYPSVWYKNNILGIDKFKGNTSSVIGTIVHACAENYVVNGELTDKDKEEIDAYIMKQAEEIPELEIEVVKTQWYPMYTTLVNTFLQHNMPTSVEDFMSEKLLDGIHLGGSCDYYKDTSEGGVVLDYKTSNTLTPPSKIPWGYKIQALAYAWLYKKQGKDVRKIAICYITRNAVGRLSEKTGKPMKDYPSTTGVLVHDITQEDWEAIENVITLIKESIEAHKKYPELTHIIYKSMSLKKEKEPTPFPTE
jgi:CRISPR/Cas system-associated exonuclease Cas4 (RecB family)